PAMFSAANSHLLIEASTHTSATCAKRLAHCRTTANESKACAASAIFTFCPAPSKSRAKSLLQNFSLVLCHRRFGRPLDRNVEHPCQLLRDELAASPAQHHAHGSREVRADV